MSSHPPLRALYLASLATIALGESIHTVLMGISGSFYDPPTVSAMKGDIVTFVFGDGIHSVTQSSPESPCTPMPGGFNSGLVSATNMSQPRQSWNLVINDTQPIYYFCQSTKPMPHCQAGMVGVINPSSISAFESYMTSAKMLTSSPQPTVPYAPTGVGAFATTPPGVTPGAPTPSPPYPTSSTAFQLPTALISSSITPSPTSVPASSRSSRNGVIAGGVVGGLVALAIIVTLAWLLVRTKRKHHSRIFPFGLGLDAGTVPNSGQRIMPENPFSPLPSSPTMQQQPESTFMSIQPLRRPSLAASASRVMVPRKRSQSTLQIHDHPYARRPGTPPMESTSRVQVPASVLARSAEHSLYGETMHISPQHEHPRGLEQIDMRALAREVAVMMGPGSSAADLNQLSPLSEEGHQSMHTPHSELTRISEAKTIRPRSPSPPGYNHHES